MSEEAQAKDKTSFLWERRRIIVALTAIIGLAAIIWFGYYGGDSTGEPNKAFNPDLTPQATLASSPVDGVASAQTTDSYIVYTSGPDSRGISQGTIDGKVQVECATINFLYSGFNPDNLDPEHNPSLPDLTYGEQALVLLGVDQKEVTSDDPIYLAKDIHVIVIRSMEDGTWKMLNNGDGICTPKK